MKYSKIFIAVVGSLVFGMSSCHDILDITPVDRYTDAVLWEDINLSKAYLLDTYRGTGIGYRQYMVTGVSDESQIKFRENFYVRGDISPDNAAPWGLSSYLPGWNDHYKNIQKLNKFLDNVGRAVEAASADNKPSVQAQVDVLRGEALFLRAYAYSELARIYGGVPLLAKESQINQDFQSITRASFEETINFIVKDCDDAAALLLEKSRTEMGKATKAAALALKSRILLFAASDLTADGTAGSKFVGYTNPNRQVLWKAAQLAAKAVMDLPEVGLESFGAPDKEQVSNRMAAFFEKRDLASPEVIWGKMYSTIDGDINSMNGQNAPSGTGFATSTNPSQKLVDTYQMEDGSNFYEHFAVDNDVYRNISGKYKNENIYKNRDPRFYATILYDSALWNGRSVDIRTRVTIENGVETKRVFGYDTENSTYNAHNATVTGYSLRKLLIANLTDPLNRNNNAYIEFRYPEILLNYAEASIALGEISEAATYINMIRNRAGMPDFTGDITQALRYERQIELAFENQRWYDMRRWKILVPELTNVYGIKIDEVTNNGVISTTWKRFVTQTRVAVDRMLWIPIPRIEINKAPQLEQNPGYN
ncbi:RagB/SusD family nutrient uptake outer membrane protein [Adhaeribacter swui]|uniref:RagB/SusD family nutrient uptake outer membrane protein n=1 Tax=Adhaeribacter swui TaxID=2086471 RepID=A0A7G7G8N6_9BACT|nr:RagB/SusD family nutrient uptake outer membrane protein [Adhaeribacter swui]QNF33520.1 RagB/SusD family nutrient uptake outer membrane protein [Adhaeribacter swui]